MKNPIFRRPPILFATGAVVGAAALATLQFVSNFGGDSSEGSDASVVEAMNSPIGSGAHTTVSEDVRDETRYRDEISSLSHIERLTSPFERSLALHELVSSADEATLIDMIKQSTAIELESHRRLCQETIFRKFAAIDPEQALFHARELMRFDRESIVSGIFEEWALIDLDEAVANAKSQSGSNKTSALKGILVARDDLSENERREIARSADNEQLANDLISQSNVQKVIDSPQLAWQSLLSDNSSDKDQVSLFVKVAQAWLEDDGIGALGEISDSLTDWQIRNQVLRPILNQLVASDAHTAFDFALSMSSDKDSVLISSLVARWASVEPAVAFEAVTNVNSFSLRSALQSSVVYRWATDSPREVLGDIDGFPFELREQAQNSALVSIANDAPEEAAELFAELDSGWGNVGIAHTIASIWSQEDSVSALEWILANPQLGDSQHNMLNVVLGVLARDNPQLALDTALDQPLGKSQIGLEANVINMVAQHDPTRARTMLEQVRDGLTRISAYQYVGSVFVREGDTDQALRLANDLSEPTRTRYTRSILSTWASVSPVSLYESLAELSSSELQSHAAFWLITNNQWRRVLSDDQVEGAEKFLSRHDWTALEQSRNSIRFHQSYAPEDVVIGSEVPTRVIRR